jgi:hypothetical protein
MITAKTPYRSGILTTFSMTILSLLFFASCENNDIKESFDPDGLKYLPMQIGNTWRLEPTDSAHGIYYDIAVKREVSIFGKQYFSLDVRLNYGSPPAPETTSRHWYYRIDSKTFVYQLKDSASSNKEYNPFRLGAHEGYNWMEGATKITATNIDSVKLKNHTVKNCKGFFADDPSIADEETSHVFAHDIGFVSISSGWFSSNLVYAKIDGVEYDFKK